MVEIKNSGVIHDDRSSVVILNKNHFASDRIFDDDSNRVVVLKYDGAGDRVLMIDGSAVNINIKRECSNN